MIEKNASSPSVPTPSGLTDGELRDLIRRVFAPRSEERQLGILVDLPDEERGDHPHWRERRGLASAWWRQLLRLQGELGLTPRLFVYRQVGANNADLPDTVWPVDEGLPPDHSDVMLGVPGVPLTSLFTEIPIWIALTELSATAPLKILARQHGIRAATMPGFRAAMLTALSLDYEEVHRRVMRLKELLDVAHGADFTFEVEGRSMSLHLDLRHRTAHASSGRCSEPGTAGNLPSGEAYIVPYEGELSGDPSRSAGLLPVQLQNEVVLFRIEANRAVAVESSGEASRRQAEYLRREPAYSNLAELGLGVLAELGVEPIGEILLDEKLGLHIAFGRSDHFGGQIGTAQFSHPSAVVHIDRIYLPQTQPRVHLLTADLRLPDGVQQPLLRDYKYVVGFK